MFAHVTIVKSSRIINEGPTLFCGAVFSVESNSAVAKLYDGNDATSGTPVIELRLGSDDPNSICPCCPVIFERGLYVTIDADVMSASIFWSSAEITVNAQ